MKRTMLTLSKEKPTTGFTLVEKPVPAIGPTEVLIKVRKTGICGTDVHIYNWDDWSQSRIKPPLIIGHEFMGEVAAIGEAVRSVKVDDRVSGEGHIGCGHCYCCRTGQGHICDKVDIIGIDVNGAFAEYIKLPEANVWKLHPGISDRIATIHDPLGNAMHTVMVDDVSGRTVLVIGAGTIGLMAINIAKAAGATEVFAVDTNPLKLEYAKRQGADHVFDAREEGFEQKILDLTNGRRGLDVLLEMSGSPVAIRKGFGLVRNGGWIALLGLPTKEVSFNLATDIIFKGITIHGINGRKIFETWYQVENFLTRNRLTLDPLITHEFPLREFEKGFELLREGKAIKVLLNVE